MVCAWGLQLTCNAQTIHFQWTVPKSTVLSLLSSKSIVSNIRRIPGQGIKPGMESGMESGIRNRVTIFTHTELVH